MTPATYRATIAGLGLTQAQVSRLLKVHPHTPSRWACGQTPIPHATALLLLAMRARFVTPANLEALAREPEKEAA